MDEAFAAGLELAFTVWAITLAPVAVVYAIRRILTAA